MKRKLKADDILATASEKFQSLKKEIAEKNILLSLTKDIAQIKAKSELMHLVKEHFKKLFDFHRCTISITCEDKKTFKIFLVDTSESKIKEHEDYGKLVTGNNTIADGIYNKILQSPLPVVFNIDELAASDTAPFYAKILHQANLKELLGVSLIYETEPIGVLSFLAEKKGTFIPAVFPLVQGIADQISLAVKNTLANEEIENNMREREMMLKISDSIARVKNRADLQSVISDKLKDLFDFSYSVILKFDDQNKVLTSFMLDPNSMSKTQPGYETMVKQKYYINDHVFKSILESSEAVVFDLEAIIQEETAPEYFKMNYNAGLRELAAIALHTSEHILGFIGFYSDKKGRFESSVLRLIKAVSYHLSTAVSNILSNEAILQREMEKEILLSVSKELTTVRERADLLPLLKNQFERLSFYSDVTIIRVDDNKETFSAFVINEDSDRLKHPGYRDMANAHHPYPDGVFEIILASEKPVIFDIIELAHWPKPLPYVQFLYENGTVEMVAIRLRESNIENGVLFLFSDKKMAFTEFQLSLVQGIGNQLGAVVGNILANEEIKNRDYEKSILLSVSKELAAVRTKEDLLRVINIKLTELFAVEEFVVQLVNEDRKTHSTYLNNVDDTKDILSQKYMINDGVLNRILDSDNPVLMNVTDFPGQSETTVYAKFGKNQGDRLLVGTALKSGENNVGALLFYLDKKVANYLNNSLLKSICSQVSISILNILANDSIKKTESEKSLLLTFSTQIATARTKKDLAVIIKQYLRNIFMISEYIITIRNADKTTYSYFLHDLSVEEPTDEGFHMIINDSRPNKKTMTSTVLESEERFVFNIENDIKKGNYYFPGESFWKAAGAEDISGIRLMVANEDVGILWIQPGKINESLLRGISAQIAVAIANIVANERIEKQFEEINDYKQQLEEEKSYLQEEVSAGYTYSDIIGSGKAIQRVFHELSQVSFANSTVLLLGETGTGKELVARAIHNSSPRKDRLMVKVNCAALPPNLIESELFGHERGSFTGATEKRIGKFELANRGTLFLDEIGEMPVDLQVKLLRAIQEKEIERVGGKVTVKTDVRIIAATNRDLQKEVDEGRFRRDLYYRLNVFPITLPPLRERIEDIPLLVSHFTKKYAKNTGSPQKNVSGKAMKELMNYRWPGNVRELEHVLERSILTTNEQTIKTVHLPVNNLNEVKYFLEDEYLKTHEENEREHILKALLKCKSKIYGSGGAAEVLGIHVSTLNSKIKKLGIKQNKTYTK
ncbi:MAG: family ATPase [Segetibacter sp.]|nr:family ATPase [Segetibacter sp.]